MTRPFLLLAAPVLALLSCEHADEAPEGIQPRSKRESAAGLLQVELQLASMEDFLEHTPDIRGRQDRLDAIRFVRAHI